MSEGRVRTAVLFIRCTDEEAERIRHAALLERRTISGYILNAVLHRIEAQEKLREVDNQTQRSNASRLNIWGQV